jgi:tRNA pseudouridine38-40 synthase
MIRNIALKISYVGTNYHGWQVQKDVPTVQSEIKKAIERLTGEKVRLVGASRTDAGVHAIGQVANFLTSSEIPPERFKYALNSLLPPDIRITKSVEVPKSFNARWSLCEKKYIYVIIEGEINPFLRNFALHIKRPLDISAMQRCAKLIEGKHDFSSFTPEKENTEREIKLSQISKKGKIILYEIVGRSFLRYMIRNIVGCLTEVGLGKISEEEFKKILMGEEKANFTAPPHGLYLADIKYPEYDMI